MAKHRLRHLGFVHEDGRTIPDGILLSDAAEIMGVSVGALSKLVHAGTETLRGWRLVGAVPYQGRERPKRLSRAEWQANQARKRWVKQHKPIPKMKIKLHPFALREQYSLMGPDKVVHGPIPDLKKFAGEHRLNYEQVLELLLGVVDEVGGWKRYSDVVDAYKSVYPAIEI